MGKTKIGNNVSVHPMPVTLVGSIVEGKANFMAVAWIAKVNSNPPMLAVGLNKARYTAEGIRQNRTFSVNFPSVDMVEEVDYCGLVSGRKADKSKLFRVFYGDTKTAPMIEGCTLCLELKLSSEVELPSNSLFIGEIVGAYTEERYLTDGKLDIKKMNPLLLTMPDNNYWAVGTRVANAFSVGKKLEQK